MVYVCDSVMGTGKTSAAITYMNQHLSDKFVYITPYLDEAKRIREQCPTLKFVEPSKKLQKFNFSKLKHTMDLVNEGRNITSTHAAFRFYTTEMLSSIKEQGYTLFIDENIDIVEQTEYKEADIEMLVESGYIEERDGVYYRLDKKYEGDQFYEFFKIIESRKLVRFESDDNTEVWYYWSLPPELIKSFKDVFILTYLFEGQGLCNLLKVNDIKYQKIFAGKNADGVFEFLDKFSYIPEYTTRLKEMIHILDDRKLNSIGDSFYALSMNWFSKERHSGVCQLKNNIINCYKNRWHSKDSERLWSCYKEAYGYMYGKGYKKRFLSFNARATNAYKDAKYLVYAVNIFANVKEKKFYRSIGIEIDENRYALSTMLQWIWRSNIRDGGEIYIYLPSRRMRTLLTDWIDSFCQGGESDV